MEGDDELTSPEEVDALDADVERLKTLYQQYFLGSLKLEPSVLRKQCYRRVLQARPDKVRNTGLRFRLRNLLQKWNGYQTYWNRILQQMEAGTYERDLDRARRRQRGRSEERTSAGPAVALSDDLSPEELQRQLAEAVAREVAQLDQKVRAPTPGATDDPPTRRIEDEFRRLVLERQAAGLPVEGLSLDDAARSLKDRGTAG